MPLRLVTFLVVAVVLTSEARAQCARETRTKEFPPKESIIPRGDGIRGADVHSIVLKLTEEKYPTCQVTTQFRVDYVQFNWWQVGRHANFVPQGGLYFDLMSRGKMILQSGAGIGWASNYCGPYGTSGLALHTVGVIPAPIFDLIDDYLIRARPISGRIAPC